MMEYLLYLNTIIACSRRSCQEVFCKNGAYKDFAKFTGSTCAEVSFYINLQARPASLLKKDTPAQVISYKFCKIFKKIYFEELLVVLNYYYRFILYFVS